MTDGEQRVYELEDAERTEEKEADRVKKEKTEEIKTVQSVPLIGS